MAKLMTVPNLLTLFRFALAAVIPWAHGPWLAAVIIVAGLSDFADGEIARRCGMTSWIGGLLDGLADKAFMITALITLAVRGQLEFWWIPLLVSRDLAVLVVVVYITCIGQWNAFTQMPARWFGKIATACLFPLLLIASVRERSSMVVVVLFILTAIFSLAAACDYLREFLREVGKRRQRAAAITQADALTAPGGAIGRDA